MNCTWGTIKTMLHVFFGNNPIAVRQKAYAYISLLEEKGAQLVRIDEDTYASGIIADAVGAVSLFGDTNIYLIDTPSSLGELNDQVHEFAQAMSESATEFVVIEGPLLVAQKKPYQKYATLEESKGSPLERFNVFALADALSRRDKKTLWIGLCEAKAQGLSAEEIIGTLWWQLKTLRLASQTKNAEEAGMKDFPYSKAKRSLHNFKAGDLEHLCLSLLSLYHQGHQGETDIDMALEEWSLTV